MATFTSLQDSTGTSGPALQHAGLAEPLFLLINLDRSRDRLALATAQLAAHGIAYMRVSGVDGAQLALPIPQVCQKTYERFHGRPLRMGEVGCYFSHLRAMETFLTTSQKYCVIFEDDIELEPEFNAVVQDLVRNELHGFEMVRLQGRRPGFGFRVAKLAENASLKVMLTRVTGSSCYMLNRTAAQRFLKSLLPMQVPYDHAFNRPLHTNVRIAFVVPYVASPRNSTLPSTIGTPRSERANNPLYRKVGPLQKLSVLRWRATSEISRGLAFGLEYLRRRKIGKKRSLSGPSALA